MCAVTYKLCACVKMGKTDPRSQSIFFLSLGYVFGLFDRRHFSFPFKMQFAGLGVRSILSLTFGFAKKLFVNAHNINHVILSSLFSTHSSPKIRKFTVAAAVMFATMLAIWWVLWMIAASQYRDFIDNWIETHRTAGYEVTYADRDTEGFPRDISLHFTDFILRNSDGVKIHAHDVSLSTFPWQWHHFTAKLKHGFELAIPFTGYSKRDLVYYQRRRGAQSHRTGEEKRRLEICRS